MNSPARTTARKEAPGERGAFLRELWYFALPGGALRNGRMLRRRLLDQPLLIGRDNNGAVFALRDHCPHRGVPLSCGRFNGFWSIRFPGRRRRTGRHHMRR